MTINKLLHRRKMAADMRGFTDEFEGEYECKWFEGDLEKQGDYMEDTLVMD